jgi:hypothetical protein
LERAVSRERTEGAERAGMTERTEQAERFIDRKEQ